MLDVAIAERICEAIATNPKSLDAICAENPDFPHRATFKRWLHQSDEIRAMYARAKATQCLLLAEQILEISDDNSQDEEEVEITEGVIGTQVNREVIDRVRIRIDARKWLCAKLAPRIFGDKQLHTGADGEGPATLIVKHIAADGE